MIIAVDPGQKGAIAWRWLDPVVENMPDTIHDIAHLLMDLTRGEIGKKPVVYLEKVGTYMPGNSGPASVTFARHCGVLDGILACLNVRVVRVSPAKWMRAVCSTLPKDKAERKNTLKALAQDLYPHIKVTLTNADALCLLHYAIQQEKKV